MRLTALLTLSVVACSSPPPVAGPKCAADETQCGSSCAKLKTDNEHCGSCDVKCEAGKACANSACFPTTCGGAMCTPDQVCFDDSCVDKSCVGVICPAGQTCSGGVCTCAGPFRACGSNCVDPRTDDSNCGMCGITCAAGESCAAGGCLPDDCGDGGACDALSVCLDGKCTAKSCVAVPCAADQQCVGGACACAPGRMQCGSSSCVDAQTDEANCGTCGHACGATERCANGACFASACGAMTCDADSVCKQGTCTEISCLDVVCQNGHACRAGVCACPSSTIECGGICTDTSTSLSHCGGCNQPCAQSCDGGVCGCPTGQTQCDGGCADTRVDVNNCGRCSNPCPTNQICSNSVCGVNSCSGGQMMCANGCTDLRFDPLNCSACGAACTGGRNCVNSACVCPTGLTFCGGQCVNLLNDPSHCGVCSKACGAGATCLNQVCTCGSGQVTCNGSCTSLNSDSANCGMCNRACSVASTYCDGGNCACPNGQSLCNGACIDTSQDNLNCGMCGRVCASNTYCSAGSCQPPFTCQTNFNTAPAGCNAFPVDTVRCGAQGTPTTTGPFTGSLATTNAYIDLPFTILQNERVSMTDVMTVGNGASNCENSLRTALNSELVAFNQTVSPPGTTTRVLGYDGSPYACAHPTIGRVASTYNGPINYSVTFDRLPLSMRTNMGSTSFATATQLATLDGGAGSTCELVCGSVNKICTDRSDDRQHFGFTLPPHKAAVFDLALLGVNGGANFHFTAIQGNGNTICNLVNNQLIGTTYSFYKARLINNTDIPQPVVVFPWVWGSGALSRFHIAAGVEP